MSPVNQTKARDAVINAISHQRFAPYLAECSGHEKNALDLYWWNVRMSRELYSALHIFEVFLRNSLDQQLRVWNERTEDRDAENRRRSPDWLLDPNDLIHRKVGDKIATASSHAKNDIGRKEGYPRRPSHDEVLSQTSFGLWALMMPTKQDSGKKKLWEEALKYAFPGAKTSNDEREVVRAIKDTHQLRNRVAHLEPIFRLDAQESLTKMNYVLKAIDHKQATWFSGKGIGKQCWEEKPQK